MRGWRRPAAAASWRRVAPRAASASRPDGRRDLALRATHARLRTRPEFLAARKGRRLNGPFFFVEARDRADGSDARYGLTVTRKVGNAVERNRIRRRLREAIRLIAGADMAPGFDYVIVARRDILAAPFEVIGQELSRRFRKTVPAGTTERRGRPSPPSET